MIPIFFTGAPLERSWDKEKAREPMPKGGRTAQF
jgi:hypothetical protein